jgi:hypothetical protein
MDTTWSRRRMSSGKKEEERQSRGKSRADQGWILRRPERLQWGFSGIGSFLANKVALADESHSFHTTDREYIYAG